MEAGDIASKEDGWIYVNAFVITLIFLPPPVDIAKSSVFFLASIVIFVLIYKLAGLRIVQKRVFFRQLIKSEIRKRRAAPGVTYDDLPPRGQEEIKVIDKYFHQHARNIISLLIFTITLVSMIIFQQIGFVPNPTLDFGGISIAIVYVGALAMIFNGVLMYDSYQEITRYMYIDQKEVYEKYS